MAKTQEENHTIHVHAQFLAVPDGRRIGKPFPPRPVGGRPALEPRPPRSNPYTIRVMKEVGIDISKQVSKDANKMFGKHFDIVATLCSEAEDECPFFIEGDEYVHKSFADPTEAKGSEEELLKVFRKTRDDLRHWIEEMLRNQ